MVCCLQPSSAGFDVGDITLTESLSDMVMVVCVAIVLQILQFS